MSPRHSIISICKILPPLAPSSPLPFPLPTLCLLSPHLHFPPLPVASSPTFPLPIAPSQSPFPDVPLPTPPSFLSTLCWWLKLCTESYFKIYKCHVVLILIDLLETEWHLIFTHHCKQYCNIHCQFCSLVLLQFYTKVSVCYTVVHAASFYELIIFHFYEFL